MRVSTAIQHHPSRADVADELLAAIPGSVLATDPNPDGPKSPWRCYRHALATIPDDATHRLVIQDDAIVCGRFAETLPLLVAARPDRLLVLFVGGNARDAIPRIRRASRDGIPWIPLDYNRWCPVVAAIWPRRLADACLAYVDRQKWPSSYRADDAIVGQFLKAERETAIATVPSLVDHPDDVPSLIGKRNRHGLDKGRIAACWIGDCDPTTVDWTLGPG